MLCLVGFAGCTGTPPAEPPVDAVSDEPVGLLAHADPLAPGPLAVTVQDYELGTTMVGGPGAAHDQYEYEALIRGTLALPDGPGPFPLAVFLHGQHNPCSDGQGREGGNCDIPYRNDQGYVYLQEHLASHGIASASILAHEINRFNGAGDVGMWARGELTVATIDALANSTAGPLLDLSRIGLMGHSRGGEGVVTAVEINALREVPHALAGVIALAPTDFAFRAVPEVPFLTLAPYCDGDVYSLHGLRQFDQSRYTDDIAAKVQLLVMGANHNNYNTMWGKGDEGLQRSGDDAGFGRHQNTECDLSREDGGERLDLEETYAQSILHLGGFLRWTLLDDAAMGAFFMGAQQPAEACPQMQACPGATHVSTMAPGRRDVFWADENGPVPVDGVSVTGAPTCRASGCAENVYQSAWLMDISIIDEAETTITFDGGWNVTDTPAFNVRLGIPTHRSPTVLGPPAMRVSFVGDETVTMEVDDPAVFMPPALPVDPGVGALGLAYLGGAKISTNAVDLHVPEDLRHDLREIRIAFSGPAAVDQVYLADAWFNPVAFGPTR